MDIYLVIYLQDRSQPHLMMYDIRRIVAVLATTTGEVDAVLKQFQHTHQELYAQPWIPMSFMVTRHPDTSFLQKEAKSHAG